MSTTVTDEQIRVLAATAKPYSLAFLRWGPERTMDGADAIELEHQRRMVSLRAEEVIAILRPVASDTVAGVAIMTVSAEEAAEIMAGDSCVPAGTPRLRPCDAGERASVCSDAGGPTRCLVPIPPRRGAELPLKGR